MVLTQIESEKASLVPLRVSDPGEQMCSSEAAPLLNGYLRSSASIVPSTPCTFYEVPSLATHCTFSIDLFSS